MPGERHFLQLQQRKSTLTADRVLPQSAKVHSWPRLVILRSEIVLRRPTEYFRNLRKTTFGQDWSFSFRKLYSNGRQSTSAICESSFLAEIGQSPLGKSTPTADRVLPHFAKVHSWPRLVILRSEIVLRRPTEYFRSKGKQKISALMLKIVNG